MSRAQTAIQPIPRRQRCAIYTRKSSEEGLDMEFNSLDAQREACEAYIKSQAHEGWRLVKTAYDDALPTRGYFQPTSYWSARDVSKYIKLQFLLMISL